MCCDGSVYLPGLQVGEVMEGIAYVLVTLALFALVTWMTKSDE